MFFLLSCRRIFNRMSLRSWICAFALSLLCSFPVGVRAFSVAPGMVDLRIDPGSTGKASIFAINSDAEADTYYVRAVPFGAREDQTGPLFDVEDTAGVVSWVQIPSTVDVPARGRTEIPVAVRVPAGTKPGGYYVAVLVSTTPAQVVASAGMSPLQANIAALLFVSVGGTGLEKMALLDLVSEGASLRDGLWGTFTYRLQNQGDVHIVPMGTVRVRDFFGRVIAEGITNEGQLRLMPQNTRVFVGTLPGARTEGFIEAVRMQLKQFALGPVTVELSLTPGLTPETPLGASFQLWILPWQLLISVFGGVVVFYSLLKLLMRRK